MTLIKFIVRDSFEEREVSYDSFITVEDFILDYLKKNSNFETLDTSVYVFIMGCKVLNTPKFLKKKIGEILSEGASVFLVRKKEINYAPILLTFEIEEDGKTKPLVYDGEITVEAFIRDYLSKNSNLVSLSTSDYTFSFGSKILNTPKFLSKKLKEIIQNGSSLRLTRKHDLHY